MAITIATGVVQVVPDIDQGRVTQAGNRAGQNTGNAFVRGLDGRIRDAEGNLVNQASLLGDTMGARLASRFLSRDRFDMLAQSLGINIVQSLDDSIRSESETLIRTGDEVGERITRGVDGRLRDSKGRFVRDVNAMSRNLGRVGGSANRVGGSILGIGEAAGIAGAGVGALGGVIKALAAASALPAIGALAPIIAGTAVMSVTAKLAFGGMGDAIGAAGGDAEKYKEELKKLGPEQKAFVEEVAAVKKEFRDFGKEIQKIVLPAFTQALKDAGPVIDIFKGAVKESAGVMAEFGKKAGEFLKSNRFQTALKANFQIGAGFVRELSTSLDDLAISFLEFGAKSKPTVDTFSSGMKNLLGQGLPGFFKGLETGIGGSAKMFEGLFNMVNKILPAFGELSGELANTFGPTLGQIFTRVGDVFRNLVDLILPSVKELAPLFESITEAFGSTRGASDGLAMSLGKGLGAAVKVLIIPLKNVVDAITIAAPVVKNLATAIMGALSPAFGSLSGKMGWADKLQSWVKNNKLAFQQIFSGMADGIMEFTIAAVDNLPTVFSMFRTLATIALEATGSMISGMAKAFGWIPGLGPKLEEAAGSFSKFKDSAIASMDKAQTKIEDFSNKVTPRLEENRLVMNIKNWELQLDTARADLKTVPPEKRAALLATITDLQNKVRDGKASLASVRDKNAKITGTNATRNAVSAAIGSLKTVRDRNAQIKATNKTYSEVDKAKRVLSGIKDKVVNILANFSVGGAVFAAKKVFGFAQGGAIPKFAGGGSINTWPLGGQIKGPGSGVSDSILARVSNGEYIIRKRAVDFFGTRFFDKLNSLSLSPAKFDATMIPGSGGSSSASTSRGVGRASSSTPVTQVVYQFNEGAIQLDASQIQSIEDVVKMIQSLRVTSRQFGARV